jgi:hypothetical protein
VRDAVRSSAYECACRRTRWSVCRTPRRRHPESGRAWPLRRARPRFHGVRKRRPVSLLA